MQNKATVHGLSSTVHFHGALNDGPLIEKLKQSHILVVPSSYEGFGIVYLEGMGFGLPAIGTTAGAASEVICDGEDGYLIPPEDVNLLAERLSALASQRDLLVRLSVNALRRFQQQPTWEQTAQSIRNFLLELTKA
jgi:glycosyltransferase involved in cell wall biosynthesis